MLSRELNPGLRCLPETDQGKVFFTVMRNEGLPPNDFDGEAPWFGKLPEQERERLNDDYYGGRVGRSDLIEQTGMTVKQLRKLARKRVRCNMGVRKCKKCRECNGRREWHWRYPMRQLLELLPPDPDELRRQEIAKNERRKAKREKAKAERMTACRGDREKVLVETLMRMANQPCIQDWSLPNISNNIVGISFPQAVVARRVAMHRALDRLERKGLVETWLYGPPGMRVRCAMLSTKDSMVAVTATSDYKPLKSQEMAVTQTCPGPLRPQTIDGESLDGEAKRLSSEEVRASTSPCQPASRPVEADGLHRDQTAVSTIDHHMPTDDKEHDMRPKLTKEQLAKIRREMKYFKDRIADIEAQFGLDEDDDKPVRPINGDNVVRLRP
jgi:hypothetical protein